MRRKSLLFYIVLLFLFSCNRINKEEKLTHTIDFYENILNNARVSTDSLLLVAEQHLNDSLKIEAYNKLFFRKVYSDTAAARNYFETLFEIGKKNPYGIVKGYNLKGIYLDIQGKYDSAYDCYQKAAELSVGKYPNVEGSAYNNIGLIYWNRGNYAEALTYYNNALSLFETIQNINLQANTLSNIGLIYMDLDDPEKSDEYFNRALIKRKELHDDYGISVSLTNLAKSYQMQGNHLEAIALYDSAAILKTKLNDEVGLSNTLYNLSDSYLKLQNPDKALALLKKAEYLCIKNGSESNNLTNIYASLCNLYFKKRQPDQMMLMLVKMKSLIDQHKDERNLKNYYTYLSDYYSLKNSYKDALLYYKKSDSIYNILEGIEVKNAIHLYETQYQTAKKEKELANAQLKITESKLLTKQKNIWLILLGFGILIVLIVFGIFREKATLKQQQLALENQLLKEQTLSKIQAQRLEISRDLHDSLGAQLTFMHTVLGGLKMIDQNMDNNLKNKINLLSDFSENSITELKNALWVLNAKEVSLEDLKIKILNFIKNASEAMDNVRFNFDAVITNNFILDSKLVVNLFRIIQEIVNNAMKYADASEVNINLYQKEKALIVTISDNGNGFDYNKERDRSFGLKNIEGRVKTIQGKMDLQTTPGKGTHYTIQVPF